MRLIDMSTQENVMIHLLTDTMSTSYTFTYMPESFFQSTVRAWLGERNLLCSTKMVFFWGGGGVDWMYGNFVGCP